MHKPPQVMSSSRRPITTPNSGYSSQDVNDEYYDKRRRDLMVEEKAKIHKLKIDQEKRKNRKFFAR